MPWKKPASGRTLLLNELCSMAGISGTGMQCGALDMLLWAGIEKEHGSGISQDALWGVNDAYLCSFHRDRVYFLHIFPLEVLGFQ